MSDPDEINLQAQMPIDTIARPLTDKRRGSIKRWATRLARDRRCR